MLSSPPFKIIQIQILMECPLSAEILEALASYFSLIYRVSLHWGRKWNLETLIALLISSQPLGCEEQSALSAYVQEKQNYKVKQLIT